MKEKVEGMEEAEGLELGSVGLVIGNWLLEVPNEFAVQTMPIGQAGTCNLLLVTCD